MAIIGCMIANSAGFGLDLPTLIVQIQTKLIYILLVKVAGFSLNILVVKENSIPTPTRIGQLQTNKLVTYILA